MEGNKKPAQWRAAFGFLGMGSSYAYDMMEAHSFILMLSTIQRSELLWNLTRAI